MTKKARKILNLLSFLIFSLVAVMAVTLTLLFIKPPKSNAEEQTTTQASEEVVIEDGDESYVGSLCGNTIQHYENETDMGFVASNNKYSYKYCIINDRKCLIKTNIKDNETDIIITGYAARNLNIIKNNLYMIMEQYDEDGSSYDVIAYLNINDDSLNTISTTKTDKITSYISDGTHVFYTTDDSYKVFQADTEGAIKTIAETNRKAEYPLIIGINNGKILYVNGIEMCSLGIRSHKTSIVSKQYCSIEQYPIVTKEGIYSFYNLAKNRIDLINFDGTLNKIILDTKDTIKFSSGIKSMNYSCGYIFFNADNSIYYLDKKENYSVKQFNEARPKTNQIYLTDEYMIIDNEKYGSPEIIKMIWLFAS